MINKDTMYAKALVKLIEVYGIEYLKRIINDTIVSITDNDKTSIYYFCFEKEYKHTNLKPNYKGWTVYATVEVDMNTGEANMIDYVLPDGTKMKDDIKI